MESRHRALVFAAAICLGVALEIAANAGCDDALAQQCRITRAETLIAEPTIENARLVRAGGRLYASWERHELIDAGGKPGLDLTGFDLAVVEPTGLLGARGFVPAPLAFRARAASVEDPTVVVEEGAEIVHWVETATTTETNGLVRTASSLKFAYVSPLRPVTAPTEGTCEKCLVTAGWAGLERQTYLFLRIDPDLADASRGLSAPSFRVLRLRRDGSVTPMPAPWLVATSQLPTDAGDPGLAPVVRSADALAVDVDGFGRINVTVEGRTWLLDSDLKLLAGPFALPVEPDVHIRWNKAATDASIAWTVSPFDEGRTTDNVTRREVFLGFVPPGTTAWQTRERTSRGRTVLAFDRDENDVGTVFESAGRTFFAALDARGFKHGGDVELAVSATASSSSEYGTATVIDQHALVARGGGVFHSVQLGSGALSLTEISCAP